MRQSPWCLLLAVSAALIVTCQAGCDKPRPQAASTEPAEPQPTASTQAATTNRPTTQQLLSGEQTRIPLRAIPFTISVPKNWQIKVQAGIPILEGPTPSGVAQIQISRHASPIAQHSDRLVEGAKRDVQANPSPYALAEVRNLSGGIRALEYRSVARTPTTSAAIDSTGRKIADVATPLQWKFTAFVPNGRDTDLCELSFIDLTREQFDLDRELLEKIIASLQYDPQAASS